jgi:tetratricopeptide (TPR) repeat protein
VRRDFDLPAPQSEMNRSKTVTITATTLLVVCLAGSIFFLRRIDQARTNATLEDVLFVTSPKAVKRLSLGYNGLLADLYWTRAVQYFGGRHVAGASHFKLLAPLLEITTTLDPNLVVAYQFGANFLSPKPPNGAGMPDKAIQLINYGIEHNPNDWKLYYELGFIYYMDLKEYPKAAEAFSRGSQVPDAHPFLKVLAAQMAQHAGDTQMARALWTTTYQTTQDKLIRANALAHLRALQVEDEVTVLESLVAQYARATGQAPTALSDLVSANYLRYIPQDPTGRPYKLVAGQRVEVEVPDDIPFIEKGTPPGYKPPHPKDLEKKNGSQ